MARSSPKWAAPPPTPAIRSRCVLTVGALRGVVERLDAAELRVGRPEGHHVRPGGPKHVDHVRRPESQTVIREEAAICRRSGPE